MIHYEVTMTVDDDVFDKMVLWLQNEHIRDVLNEPGFVKAELLLEDLVFGTPPTSAGKKRRLRVIYFNEDGEKLRAYLQHKAPALREKGVTAFPGKFQAERAFWTAPLMGPVVFHTREHSGDTEHEY